MNFGQDFRGMGPYLTLGIQMVVVTLVGAAIGWWLDEKTGKSPWFLAVFFLLGALGGIIVVWKALNGGDGSRQPPGGA
ncbi:AtpZ/AtpI family protein [bacterium]|nr:AtpZ/AtpI family protein [bacterium]